MGDASVPQDGDRVREAFHLAQQVGDVHDGQPLGAQVLDPFGQGGALGGGEGGGGLVEDEDRGAAAERLGDLNQLPLPHGEFTHPVAW